METPQPAFCTECQSILNYTEEDVYTVVDSDQDHISCKYCSALIEVETEENLLTLTDLKFIASKGIIAT